MSNVALQPRDDQICVLCHRTAIWRCPPCHTRYCGVECQKLDWDFHRWQCKPLATKFHDDKRPSTLHFRVMVFHHGGIGPNWMWWHVFESAAQVFTASAASMSFMRVEDSLSEHVRRGCEREIMIMGLNPLVARQINPDRPQVLNRSIARLGRPGHMFPWEGTMIVCSWDPYCLRSMMSGNRAVLPPTLWNDLTTVDFRRALDYLRWHSCNAVINDQRRFPESKARLVLGVKLNCFLDVENAGLSEMEPAWVYYESRRTAGEQEDVKLPATGRMGVPLLSRVVHLNRLLKGGPGRARGSDAADQERMHSHMGLYLQIEQDSDSDVEMMTAWTNCEVGNIIVFREDGKPLSRPQLHGMVSFLCDILYGDGIGINHSEEVVTLNGAIYREENTPERFRMFWTAWLDKFYPGDRERPVCPLDV